MSVPEKDGRLLWLDEGQVHAGKFLAQVLHKEKTRDLTISEEKLKQLAASYCYLYEKAKDSGILEEEESYFLFENEKIH
jgi:hypothetical protein